MPDHDGVLEENLALVGNLSPSPVVPNGLEKNAASVWQPFEYAYFEVLGASPSVDERVSDGQPLHVFWAWGEKHVPYAASSLPAADCANSYFEIGENGTAHLNGTLRLAVGNWSEEEAIGESAPNPLDFSLPAHVRKELQIAKAADGSAVFPNLTIAFDGQVIAQYRWHEILEVTDSSPSQGGISNIRSCGTRESTYQKNLTYPLHASRAYIVELGEPMLLLLQPADLEQLAYAPGAQGAAMLSRLPQRMEWKLENQTLAQANFSTYEYERDEFNFTRIKRVPKSGDAPRYRTAWPNVSVKANSTRAYFAPTAMDAQNRSFAFQYYMKMKAGTEEWPAGAANLRILVQDEFGRIFSKSWTARARNACGIYGKNSDEAQAVCIQNITAPPVQTAGGGGGRPSQAALDGSDAMRPAGRAFGLEPASEGWILLAVPAAGVLALGMLVWRRT